MTHPDPGSRPVATTHRGAAKIRFAARDGFHLGGLYTPALSHARSAVLIAPGTGFPASYYAHFATALAARGAASLILDYRGIGLSGVDDLAALDMDYPDWGRLDMPAALDALAECHPDLPLVLLGHSVGGHFLGFMDNHAAFAHAVFVCVGSGYWRDHAPLNIPLELAFWHLIGPFSLWRHGYVRGRGIWAGESLPRGVFQTWKRWCQHPDYFAGELRDGLAPHWFGEVTTPITAFLYTDDPIANPRTGRTLLSCYPAATATTHVKHPQDYSLGAIGHGQLFRRASAAAWEDVIAACLAPAV